MYYKYQLFILQLLINTLSFIWKTLKEITFYSVSWSSIVKNAYISNRTLYTIEVGVNRVLWKIRTAWKFSGTQPLRQSETVWRSTYTGCPRRNVPDFGRVFLMLKYTDITQNTYVQNWTVTEIMVREKCGLLAGPRTVPVSWQVLSMFVLECGVLWRKVRSH